MHLIWLSSFGTTSRGDEVKENKKRKHEEAGGDGKRKQEAAGDGKRKHEEAEMPRIKLKLSLNKSPDKSDSTYKVDREVIY